MAERTCSIDGCEGAVDRNGYCVPHYHKAWRYGDPLHVPPRQAVAAMAERLYGPILDTPTCQVAGCGRPKIRRRGKPTGRWCAGHMRRWNVSRDVGLADMRAPDGAGYVRLNGYRVLGDASHPLADAAGQVYEHRAVAYRCYGSGPHVCGWCGAALDGWSSIHVDHLDGDRLHNEPSNLVLSCASCNAARANAGNPRDWTPVKPFAPGR